MTDIAQHLPTDSKTVTAIYDAYKRKGDAEQSRGYLGASIIGHNCERYLWYNFRFCCKPEFSGRMYRLFDTGNHEESRFVADLRSIGCVVHEFDESGKQFAVQSLGGHFSGHMDGCVLGVPDAPKTWHVAEFKTHSAKSFAKLKKEGVKKSKPQHYAQMQVYMGLTGMDRALYLAVNKDTDELYSERIHLVLEDYYALMARAERVIKSNEPPYRISERPDYYECSYCAAKEICHGSDKSALPIPAINCRQCCYATPMLDGNARWVCEKHKRGLSEADQSKACEDHLILPGLISFAEPVDANAHKIKFKNNNGSGEWNHGGYDANNFSTKELMTLPASSLVNPLLEKAKSDFGAEVTASSNIIARYPETDSRIVWKGKQKDLLVKWMELYGEDMNKTESISKENGLVHQAVEFQGGRVAIIWTDPRREADYDAEIREGIN